MCDSIVHNSQLNAYNISIHMYLTIQHILNLSHTPNLNHNVIIPKHHVITPQKSYTHKTILIYTWHKHVFYLWTMHYTQLLNCFQNHFNLSRLKVIQLVGFPPWISSQYSSPLRVLQLCDCTIHSSQLNTYNISIHVYLTIYHIFNLLLTHIFNHNFMIRI